MALVIIRHKVEDLAAWKASMAMHRPNRLPACLIPASSARPMIQQRLSSCSTPANQQNKAVCRIVRPEVGNGFSWLSDKPAHPPISTGP